MSETESLTWRRMDVASPERYRHMYRDEIAKFKLKYGFEPPYIATSFRSYLDTLRTGIPTLIEAEVEKMRRERIELDLRLTKERAERESAKRAEAERRRRERAGKLVDFFVIKPVRYVRKILRALEERTRP